MAEQRRPASSSRSSRSPRRTVQVQSGGMPKGALIAMIVIPLLLIAGGVSWKLLSKPREEVQTRNDPASIESLRKRAAELQREYLEVVPLIRKEDPAAGRMTDNLKSKLDQFMADFESVMKPYMDEDGYIKDEYAGYKKIRQPIVQINNDLSKQTGFGLDE